MLSLALGLNETATSSSSRLQLQLGKLMETQVQWKHMLAINGEDFQSNYNMMFWFQSETVVKNLSWFKYPITTHRKQTEKTETKSRIIMQV